MKDRLRKQCWKVFAAKEDFALHLNILRSRFDWAYRLSRHLDFSFFISDMYWSYAYQNQNIFLRDKIAVIKKSETFQNWVLTCIDSRFNMNTKIEGKSTSPQSTLPFAIFSSCCHFNSKIPTATECSPTNFCISLNILFLPSLWMDSILLDR